MKRKRGGFARKLLLLAGAGLALVACTSGDPTAPRTLRSGECRCGDVAHGPRYCRYRFKTDCEINALGAGGRVPTAELTAATRTPSAPAG